VIKSFRHKGLAQFFLEYDASKIRPDLIRRVQIRLSALNAARSPEELNLPGFDFHRLRGKPVRYSIHVNGPFCLTFEWIDGDAYHVDLENYH
jgi:toxin HigB-1